MNEGIPKREAVREVLDRRNIEGTPTFSELRSALEKYLRDTEKLDSGAIDGSIEKREIQDVADAVILDFDGVIFASLDAMAEAGVRVIEKLGGHAMSRDEFWSRFDNPYVIFYSRYGIQFENSEDKQLFYEEYQAEYRKVVEEMGGIDLYDDALVVIHDLIERGLKLFILSAKDHGELEQLLIGHGIHDKLNGFIGGQEDKVEAIKRCVEENGFDAERVIMFGDLPSDIRHAHAAGIKAAGVARFEGNADRLASYDPDYLVRSMADVLSGLSPHIDKLSSTEYE